MISLCATLRLESRSKLLNAANNATISAIHGYEGSKKQFCDQQSNKAFIEAIIPGGAVLLGGDYRPTAVVGATAEVAVDRAVDAAAGSSWFLYKFGSLTGVPMTTTAKFLKGFGYVTSAISLYDAVKAMQKEYKACME